MAAKGTEMRVTTGDADTYTVRCGLEKVISHPIIAITGQDKRSSRVTDCFGTTRKAISQAGEKMFLAICKAPANGHNLNNNRHAAFLKSSTKIKADLSSIPPTKRAELQHSISNVFLFVAPDVVPILMVSLEKKRRSSNLIK
ncbi:hypothetical protein AVEN_108799-1 [Araneus ventricosus]|uniref:Uncharacterized protein n=1 Tax=Araneus ventricosus TaxID=182803 RepID=A0A4Y2CE62_ARAVE|nr:hypothetical protein AVEN_108799-1 [Araneus ventricosus]